MWGAQTVILFENSKTYADLENVRRPCKQRPRKHRRVTNTKTAFARERNEFKSLSSSFLFLLEVCVFETPLRSLSVCFVTYDFSTASPAHQRSLSAHFMQLLAKFFPYSCCKDKSDVLQVWRGRLDGSPEDRQNFRQLRSQGSCAASFDSPWTQISDFLLSYLGKPIAILHIVNLISKLKDDFWNNDR